MEKKKHLTAEGILEIDKIKNEMNTKRLQS